MADEYETPESAGSFAADLTLRQLFQRGVRPEEWDPVLRQIDERDDAEWPGFGARLATKMWRDFRTMAKAGETLGIKEPKEPKP